MNKVAFRVIVFLVAVVSLGSCEKESDSDSPIVGNWVDSQGQSYPTLRLDSKGKYELKVGPNKEGQHASGNYIYTDGLLELKWNLGNLIYRVTFNSDTEITMVGGRSQDQPSTFKLKRK